MVGGSKGQILIGVQYEYHMFPLLRASPLPSLICHVLIWRKMEERGDVRPQSLPMRLRKVLCFQQGLENHRVDHECD